jgi:hypothetical protein
MPRKNKNHLLLSKGDLGRVLGITTQTFANRATRDPKFPQPTYSNASGSVALYSQEDAKKVYDYMTQDAQRKLDEAKAKFERALSGDVDPDTDESEDGELEGQADALAELTEGETPADETDKTQAPKVDPATDAEFDAALTSSAPVTLDKGDDKGKADAPKLIEKADDKTEGVGPLVSVPAKADEKPADAPKADAKADAPKAAPRARGGALTPRK